MHRVIDIDLEGQASPFRVHDDAYDTLHRYLGGARARLANDPDAADVLGDLERSIGAKLADRLGATTRVLTVEDVQAVLTAIGPVGPVGSTDDPASPGEMFHQGPPADRTRRRRLMRIQAGQQIAGVCTGVAAYSEIRVDWVRTIFVLLTLGTVGAFALVYVGMAFVLPIVPTAEAWLAEQEAAAGP